MTSANLIVANIRKTLQRDSGATAEALALVETGLDHYPDDIRLLKLGYRCAVQLVDPDRALAFCTRLMEKDATNLDWPIDLARLYRHLGETDSAIKLLRSQVNAGQATTGMYLMAAHLPLPAGLKDKVISWAKELADSRPAFEHEAATIVQARLGMAPNRASDGDGSNLQRQHRLQMQRAILAKAPDDERLLRPLVVDDPTSEILLATAPDSPITVLVFTGLADRTGMPIDVLDRYLAALGVQAVYLRDSSRFLFNKGISSIAKDFPGTVQYLHTVLESLGSKRLVTLGSSSGSFAAVRYGIEMGAVSILGFPAVTNVSADFLDRIGENRGKIVAKRLQALPVECRDLQPFIRQAQRRCPIHLFYGERMQLDRRHAHHIAEEPDVELHPIPGIDQHNILGVLAENGELLPLLGRHLLDSPRSPA